MVDDRLIPNREVRTSPHAREKRACLGGCGRTVYACASWCSCDEAIAYCAACSLRIIVSEPR